MTTAITVSTDRMTFDPTGEMSDEDYESACEYVLDAVRTAFPGADVIETNSGRTCGTTGDGHEFDQDVRDVVQQAWTDWCEQG